MIIDENIAISRAIQHYLEPLGFGSFDLTWTEHARSYEGTFLLNQIEEAVEVALAHTPGVH